ncbi:MAG: IclR family transcriptional regulator [Acidobacteriota bacterium]
MEKPSRRKSAVYSAPALEKGLDILEALASVETPQSLSDLARALGRSSSELFRVLSSLEKRAYIVRDSAGRYRLSLKLYELAHIHPPVGQLLRATDAPMRALARSLRQSCHLSVLSRGQLLVLAEAGSPEKVRLSIAVGSSFSATRTASGRLLLARLPEEERRQFLERDPDFRRQTDAEKKRLRAALGRIIKAGHSTAENETYMGIRDVAVPVGNTRIGLDAALDVSLWVVRGKQFDSGKILNALRSCARRITQSMGVTQA